MFYFVKCNLQTNGFCLFDLLILTCFTLSNVIHKPLVTVYLIKGSSHKSVIVITLIYALPIASNDKVSQILISPIF